MGKRKKVMIIVALITIVVVIGFIAVKVGKGKQEEGLAIKTVEILREDIESHIQTTGEVLAIEKREITSDAAGRVLDIAVEKGQSVAKGQVLLTLDASEVEYQLKQAQIKLDIERDTLEQMKKGDKLELEINRSNSEILYNEAKKTYEQTKELYDVGAVSLNEVSQAKIKLDQANNAFILSQKNLENANNASQITIQQKHIELSLLNVEKLREEKEKYVIKSPIDGTVVDMNIEKGSIISPTLPVMVVMDTDQLEIAVNVSEYDVDKMKLGDPVKITGDAIEGKEYKGTVRYIAPTAISIAVGQGRETVVEVKVGVVSKDTSLKPGFSAVIDILTEVRKDALVIPYEGLFTRKDGQKLIFSVQEGKAKIHEIKTGIESDLVVEIIGDDIKEKDKIILNPTESLKDGDPVIEDRVSENDKNK